MPVTGSGVGAFGGGFAKGLTSAMLHNQERHDQQQKEARAEEMQKFGALFPVFLQNYGGDQAEIDSFMSQFPNMSKSGIGQPDKKGDSPFAKLAPWLHVFKKQGGQTGQPGAPAAPGAPYPGEVPQTGTGALPAGIAPSAGAPPAGVPSLAPPPTAEMSQMFGGQLGAPPVTPGAAPSPGTPTPGLLQPPPPVMHSWFTGQPPQAAPTGEPGITASAPSQPILGSATPIQAESLRRRQALGLPMTAKGTQVLADQPAQAAAASQASGAPPAAPIPATTLPGTGSTPAIPPTGTPSLAAHAAVHHNTVFGVPLLTHQEKIDQQVEDQLGLTMGMMSRVRDVILPTLRQLQPDATLEDALRVAGVNIPIGRSIGQTGPNDYGDNIEAVAGAMFNKTYNKLTQEEKQAVLEQVPNYVSPISEGRGAGTARAKFNAPMTAPEAQTVPGATVGTTSAELAGQTVPTQDVATQRRDLTTLRSDIEHIRTLLGALPSQATLSGRAPGAVLAVRKRMNSPSDVLGPDGNPLSYRESIAQLSSAVDQVVNALARTRGQQRGAQTEKDAERAYNAVVQLQAGLMDPFGGDTRESADIRIKETLDGLDRVLGGLPAPVTPKPETRPASATTPKVGSPAGGTPAPAAAPAVTPAPSHAAPAPTAPAAADFEMRSDGIYVKGVKTYNADGTPVGKKAK